jgi:hypothetical protein
MAWLKFFRRKGEDNAVEVSNPDRKLEQSSAVAGSPAELDTKLADVINENVAGSVEQKQKIGRGPG